MKINRHSIQALAKEALEEVLEERRRERKKAVREGMLDNLSPRLKPECSDQEGRQKDRHLIGDRGVAETTPEIEREGDQQAGMKLSPKSNADQLGRSASWGARKAQS